MTRASKLESYPPCTPKLSALWHIFSIAITELKEDDNSNFDVPHWVILRLTSTKFTRLSCCSQKFILHGGLILQTTHLCLELCLEHCKVKGRIPWLRY